LRASSALLMGCGVGVIVIGHRPEIPNGMRLELEDFEQRIVP
jgi:hypothetical protein